MLDCPVHGVWDGFRVGVGRFDVRPRARDRTDIALERERNWLLHVTSRAAFCACGRCQPVECLCCGRQLCFFCGGRVTAIELAEVPAPQGDGPVFDDLEALEDLKRK